MFSPVTDGFVLDKMQSSDFGDHIHFYHPFSNKNPVIEQLGIEAFNALFPGYWKVLHVVLQPQVIVEITHE